MYIHDIADLAMYRDYDRIHTAMDVVRFKVIKWFRRRFPVTTSLWPVVQYLNGTDARLQRYLWHLIPHEEGESLTYIFDDIFHDFWMPSFVQDAFSDEEDNVVKKMCDNIMCIMHDDALYEAAQTIPCLTWVSSFIIAEIGVKAWMARLKEMRVKTLTKNYHSFVNGDINYLSYNKHEFKISELCALVNEPDIFAQRIRNIIPHGRFQIGFSDYIRHVDLAMDWSWYLKRPRYNLFFELDYALTRTPHKAIITQLYHGEMVPYSMFVDFVKTGVVSWVTPAGSDGVLLW